MSNLISHVADKLRRRGISPIIVGIALTLLIWGIGAGFVYFLVTKSVPAKPPVVEAPPTPEVKTAFRRAIDGVLVSDATLEQPVVYGAMIDNILEARPPSGISKASLVFELPVEMGITRFLAVFAQGDAVAKIGPIRSARPYAVDFMSEFNGLYLHVGGSPKALDEIAVSPSIFNVDELASSKTIYRVKTRPAPHNAYSSSDNMDALIKKQTNATFGPVESWLYRDEKKLSERSGNAGVVVAFSTNQYEAEWKYDSTQNDYIRYEGRVRHKDEDGSEIRAKNVAVLITSATVIPGDEKGRIDMSVIGEGQAYILSEGAVTKGTWKKPDAKSRLKFFDADGGEMVFIPGITWVEVAPGADKVKIKE